MTSARIVETTIKEMKLNLRRLSLVCTEFFLIALFEKLCSHICFSIDRDRPMQGRWHRRYAKSGGVARHHIRRFGCHTSKLGCQKSSFPSRLPVYDHTFLSPHAKTNVYSHLNGRRSAQHSPSLIASASNNKVKDSSVDMFDAALQEAMRRSLEDLKDSEKAASTNEMQECRTVVRNEQDEMKAEIGLVSDDKMNEEFDSSSSSLSLLSSFTKKSSAQAYFTSDARGNGEVAIELGLTMDKIACAIEEMNSQLDIENCKLVEHEKKSSDLSIEEEGDEKIIEVETGVESIESENIDTTFAKIIYSGAEDEIKDDETSSWERVDHGTEQGGSLAQAAIEVGSALFESGISNCNVSGNVVRNTADSTSTCLVDSAPTTLPSPATGASVSTVSS